MNNVGYSFKLKEIIAEKTGAERFTPTAKMLNQLGMTSRRFNAIYTGKAEPFFSEIIALAFQFNIRTINEMIGSLTQRPTKMKVVQSPGIKQDLLNTDLARSLADKYNSKAI